MRTMREIILEKIKTESDQKESIHKIHSLDIKNIKEIINKKKLNWRFTPTEYNEIKTKNIKLGDIIENEEYVEMYDYRIHFASRDVTYERIIELQEVGIQWKQKVKICYSIKGCDRYSAPPGVWWERKEEEWNYTKN